ncbi:MAG: MATE family efflux transporter [Oribacterium sp.]|nr:MATE family efflux transporter [Oribacterium sp.]MBO6307582.1 MATE family efflux transporter [Oribacterium sp.]
MNTELQSNVLSADTIKKVMPSCMVYALVQSMTFMVDTIVAGHFLGSDAVAGVALGMPIIGLMLSFTGMILQGGFLKMLGAMGRSNMDDYDRLFSLTLAFSFIVDVVFLGICIFGTETVLDIVGAAKATAEAVRLGKLYMQTACLMILFFSLGSLLQIVMATYGYQTDRMLCSVICVAVNVITSMIFINILPERYRIAGLGIGSALATFSQMLTAWLMMRKRGIKVRFSLYPPSKDNVLDSLDMLRRGLPSSVDNMLDSVSGSVVNRIILSSFADGTGVLALVTIIKTLWSIIRTVGRGAFYASEPLIGILYGGRDNEGIKKTFQAALRIGIIYALGMGALFIILKNPLLAFYHVNENPVAHIGVVMLAFGGLLTVFSFAFNAVYESTGHLFLSLLVAVVPDSVLYPMLIPVLSRSLGVVGVWMAMSFNFIPFFILFYIVFIALTRKLPVPLERLLALKEDAGRSTALDVSIPTDAKNVVFVSEQLQNFFLKNGIPRRASYVAALSTEEIVADYLAHRDLEGREGKKAYMDIKVFSDVDKIEIIIRNYDEPYNPLVLDAEAESFSKIGVTMIQKMARDISYSYAYHLNVVSIIIDVCDQ